MNKFVTYYRVSTKKQGDSGLGLEAQEKSVHQYIHKFRDAEVLGSFTDIESGKNDIRLELKKAIAMSKSQDATLVIAKLDRLSRNVTFISTLMDNKVKFVCCDMPDANELTIHIFAAIAQWERKRISERTRAALSALQDRGAILGDSSRFTDQGRLKGARARRKNSQEDPYNIKAWSLVEVMKQSGFGHAKIAERLNEKGFTTPRGAKFDCQSINRLIKLYANENQSAVA